MALYVSFLINGVQVIIPTTAKIKTIPRNYFQSEIEIDARHHEEADE